MVLLKSGHLGSDPQLQLCPLLGQKNAYDSVQSHLCYYRVGLLLMARCLYPDGWTPCPSPSLPITSWMLSSDSLSLPLCAGLARWGKWELPFHPASIRPQAPPPSRRGFRALICNMGLWADSAASQAVQRTRHEPPAPRREKVAPWYHDLVSFPPFL